MNVASAGVPLRTGAPQLPAQLLAFYVCKVIMQLGGRICSCSLCWLEMIGMTPDRRCALV